MMDKQQLIERNLVEIISPEELAEVINNKSSPVTYCGYETSGPVHIGTMVPITKQIDFLNAGFKVKVLFADLHTYLNRKGEKDWVERMLLYWEDCFSAFGLKNAEFVKGSDFEYSKEYMDDIFNLGLHTTLNRAIRSMQEVARDIEHANVSQMMYPLMQVADIKALGVDISLGGMEQRKIHALAREMLPLIGYGKVVCVHTPLLPSLQGPQCKMSSSKPETMISVSDSIKDIKSKVKKAYCPEKSTEGNPITEACKYLVFPKYGKLEIKRSEKFGGNVEFDSYPDLENAYIGGKVHPLDLKNAVSDAIIELTTPIRDGGIEMPR